MNKVVLAGLALILVRDCDIGGPRFHGQIKGTWGGDNAGLMAFDTTAHVHIGCTAGDTKQAIVADEQGRFDTPGRYNITLYPVARGPDHPARFTGSTDGHVMTLTVTLTDTAVTLGPVRLEIGRSRRWGRARSAASRDGEYRRALSRNRGHVLLERSGGMRRSPRHSGPMADVHGRRTGHHGDGSAGRGCRGSCHQLVEPQDVLGLDRVHTWIRHH